MVSLLAAALPAVAVTGFDDVAAGQSNTEAAGNAFKTVSAGHDHSCGVRTDNTVTCWGLNAYGQANAPAGKFKTVSAGREHSCGVKADNTIVCWGFTNYGQNDAPEGKFKTVSAGSENSCGVKADNTIVCWGSNDYGQNDVPEGKFKTVSAGIFHSCGVRTDNTIVCWGITYQGQADAPEGKFKTVSAAREHSCGVKTDSTVTCWGANNDVRADAPDGHFKSVSAGEIHSCGVKTDNTVTCWGRGWGMIPFAPAGTDSISDSEVISGNNENGQVYAPAGAFKTVFASTIHACGVKTDNTVTCWGDHIDRALAGKPASEFKTVSAGGDHSCGVKTDNTVACWGSNYQGQADAPEGKFKTVSAGSENSCGVRTDNTVICWGDNRYGQTDAPEGAFKTVSAGKYHSCGVKTDSTVICWGDSVVSGRADAPAGEFKTVSASGWHSCGVKVDNTVACWGGIVGAPAGEFKTVSAGPNGSSCGVRADNTVTCWGAGRDAPAGAFKTVSAGGFNACGVKTDDTVTCWGSHDWRQADAPGGEIDSGGGGGPVVAVVEGGLGPSEVGPGQGVPCAVDTPTCRYINIELSGFEAGVYTVSCAHDGWGDVGPSTFWTFSVTVDQSGSASLNGPCFLNFAKLTGEGAYVKVSGSGVDAVTSNWLQPPAVTPVTPVTPVVPSDLRFSSGLVSWSAVSGATSYNVGLCVSEGTVNGCVVEGDVACCSLTISDASLTHVRVQAVNSAGSSAWSSDVQTRSLRQAPGQVTGQGIRVGEFGPELFWQPTQGATSYDIDAREVGTDLQSYRRGITCSGGTCGYLYREDRLTAQRFREGTGFRVRAVNDIGVGPWSGWVTAAPTGPPGRVEAIEYRSGKVHWNPVAGATHYTIAAKWRSGSKSVSGMKCCDYSVDRRDNETVHYRVRAENSAGKGRWSGPVSVDPAVPIVPRLIGTPEIWGFDIHDFWRFGAHDVTIKWIGVSHATSYKVETRYRSVQGSMPEFSGNSKQITNSVITWIDRLGKCRWFSTGRACYSVDDQGSATVQGKTEYRKKNVANTDEDKNSILEFRVTAYGAAGDSSASDWTPLRDFRIRSEVDNAACNVLKTVEFGSKVYDVVSILAALYSGGTSVAILQGLKKAASPNITAGVNMVLDCYANPVEALKDIHPFIGAYLQITGVTRALECVTASYRYIANNDYRYGDRESTDAYIEGLKNSRNAACGR
ncbi:MAG: hypothetical protein KTU85_12115 [Acidimicrobiia bacterium]|nr:hypothetical protein [Acidimicrobiia bacterium]